MLHRTCLLTIVALAESLVMAACAAAVRADAPAGDVWLISTRQAARCGEHRLAEQPVHFWQVDGDRWSSRSLDALKRAERDDPRRTFLFIHGNRESLQSAITNAEAVRGKLEASGRNYRLLIWAWPSDRIGRRQRPDVQLKHAYTPTQAGYLAELLRLLDHREEVCLVGYSFGAQIAVDATARMSKQSARRIRLVLVAAAVDAGDLSSCGRFAAAADIAEQIIVTRNCFDPALRFYPRMYGRRGPQALGYVGPCGGSGRLNVVELSCAVGKTHAWLCYAAAIDPTIYFAPDPNPPTSAKN